MYRALSYLARPKVTIKILGDPAYLPPFAKEHITKEGSVDKSNITIGDVVKIKISDPAGKPVFLGGTFLVLGFNHNLNSAGDYTTTVNLIKHSSKQGK